MRLAIRAEGGDTIGMGHLLRCAAIARECLQRGHEVLFFARESSCLQIKTQALESRTLPKCQTVTQETAAFIAMAGVWGADIALLDCYELTESCYTQVRANFFCVAIDDTLRLPYHVDVLINANLYAPMLDYSLCEIGCALLGGQYAMLRPEFRDAPIPPFRDPVDRILITMGGADVNNYTPVVLTALRTIPEIQPVVVLGPAARNLKAVRHSAGFFERVELYQNPNHLAALFSSCSLAISAAGTTTSELCALGIPTILIRQADNQDQIHAYFQRNGAMLALGDYAALRPERIADAVMALKRDPDTRSRMRETTLRLVDRRGAAHIVELLERKIQQ